MSAIMSVGYKDLILRKLYHSVISSVGSQMAILLVYVFLSNISLFHPLEWTLSTINVFASFGTWIFLFPFIAIIFAQSIICGKDYIYKPSYSITRFQKLLSVFSVHNWVILLLNVIIGASSMWLFLELSGGSHKKLIKQSKDTYCLNEDTFYLILSGIWNGIYYFYKVHFSGKHLIFPVIYQRKIIQIKSEFLPLLKESCVLSTTATIYFIILHFVWGEVLITNIIHFLEVERVNYHIGSIIYLYLWVYGTLYYYKMNMMRYFFNLFLTEPVVFPLYSGGETAMHLQDSISMTSLPIIQNLACLDLHNLAQWSISRRQVFFTLSQPGGHPHNWNSLVENVLKLFSMYSEILNTPTDTSDIKLKNSPPQFIKTLESSIQANMQLSKKFTNMRNMSLISGPSGMDIVELTREPSQLLTVPKQIWEKCLQKVGNIVSLIKILLGVNFLFNELPQVNIQRFLANGHIIIWVSEGISDLACASLTEDQYGIVQKDLPAIITALVDLKQNLDKLNKVPTLTRKIAGHEDFNLTMKAAVTSAVKRSLFNIYNNFGNYLHELPLNNNIVSQIQIMFKN